MTLLTLILSACTRDEGAGDAEVQSATSASSTAANASTSGTGLEPQTSSTLDVPPPQASSAALPSEPSTTSGPVGTLPPTNPAPTSSSPPDAQPEPSVEPQPTLSAQPEQSNDPETEPPGTEEETESDPQEQSETEPEENPSDAGGSSTSPPAAMEGCEDGPLELPIEGCAPEFEETSDFYADCVARINQLRWQCQCLPPLERWTEAESCADQQARYDYEVMEAHAGISAEICEPGGGSQNECPGYGGGFGIVDFCLQQMWDEGPGEDFQVHGHYINMSSETVTRVACGRFETADGEIWSVQNFSR